MVKKKRPAKLKFKQKTKRVIPWKIYFPWMTKKELQAALKKKYMTRYNINVASHVEHVAGILPSKCGRWSAYLAHKLSSMSASELRNRAVYYKADQARALEMTKDQLISEFLVPATGSFIGFKRAKILGGKKPGAFMKETLGYTIVILQVPAKAKRQQSCFNKVRVSEAKVLGIIVDEARNGGPQVGTVLDVCYSAHDHSFKYRVGQIIKPTEPFDENIDECSSGIHMFMTMEQAKNYSI